MRIFVLKFLLRLFLASTTRLPTKFIVGVKIYLKFLRELNYWTRNGNTSIA